MFTTKNKIILGVLAGIALIMLILGIFFLVNDNKQHDEKLDYFIIEEAIHKIGENNNFPTDLESLQNELNHNLPDEYNANIGNNVITINYYDSYNNNYLINPVADNCIELISIGKDCIYQTNDDITISFFVERRDNIKSIVSTNLDHCPHKYLKETVSPVSCEENGITKNKCMICNHLKTDITLSAGHKFDKEGCSESSECLLCHQKISTRKHLFVVMDTSELYLDKQGSCITPSTYFYKCAYCNLMSTTETFSYTNPTQHNNIKDEKIELNAYTFIHRQQCHDCNKELISAVISNTSGIYEEGNSFKPIIYTLDQTEYSLDNITWTKDIPSISAVGDHNIFYKITRDKYTLSGTVSINLQDLPQIIIHQVDENLIYEVDELNFKLTGYVLDQQGIDLFMINNTIIDIDENGNWSYEGTLINDSNNSQRIELLIRCIAIDSNNNYSAKSIMVVYNKKLPTNISYIHTNQNTITISGQIENVEYVQKVLVNQNEVKVDQDGKWETIIYTKENQIIEVVTEIYSITDDVAREVIKICHCNKTPTASVHAVDGNLIMGTIQDTGFDCSTIQEINVYNVSHLNGITLVNATMSNKAITNGFNIYTKSEKDIDYIDFEINFDEYSKQDYFEVEITTTHGQSMLYQFNLTWNDNEVSKIHLVIINQVTGETSEMDVPLSLLDMVM